MNCVFCKIINNELPSYYLYEDEIVKVFLSIDPISNGHALIVPKEHYVDITDIPLEVLNHINKVAKRIYEPHKKQLNFDGLKFVQNNGSLQEVKHYHLHMIPYYKNDTKIMPVEEVYEILKK